MYHETMPTLCNAMYHETMPTLCNAMYHETMPTLCNAMYHETMIGPYYVGLSNVPKWKLNYGVVVDT